MLETGHAVAAGLFPFAISYALLAMLPGANFAVVALAGLTASRTTALSAAAGIALGASSLAMVVATGAAAYAETGVNRRLRPSCIRFWIAAIIAAAAVASDFKTTKPAGLGPAGSEPATGNPPASALA